MCEISSSHGGEYEAQNLLGCTAVFLIECRPMRLTALMMEAARTFETSVNIQLRTLQYIPEVSDLHRNELFIHPYLLNFHGCNPPRTSNQLK
jgi:hypothetical protein